MADTANASAPGTPGLLGGLSAVDRRALRSVATQFFVNGAIAGTILARFPELRAQIALPLGRWGLLLTTAGAFGLVGSIFTSRLIERYRTRRVMIAGAAAQVSLVALVGLSMRPWLLLVALGGIAIVDVTIDIAMNLQGSWISSRRRVPVMNRLHGLWSLGTLVGGLVSSQMASQHVPLRWHMLGATLVLLPLLWFVGRGLLVTDERPASETNGANPNVARYSSGFMKAAFALAAAGAATAEFVPNDWSALRLSTDLGTSAGAAALGFVAITVGMTIGRFGGDFVAAWVGRETLFWSSIVAATIGFGLSFLVPIIGVAYVGFTLGGLGVATFFPTIYDEGAQSPGRTGAALGAVAAGSRGAGLVMPTIIGALSATSMPIGTAASIVAVPALAVLASTHVLLRRSTSG